jgi:hypothetical protein
VAPKQWRVSLDIARGDFFVSHVADDPALPPHEHHVRLGLTHTELTAQYGLRPNMQLAVRLPYDVKAMRVRYSLLDGGAPYTPPYGDIHHRTETLRGISDPSVRLELAPRDRWVVGLGTTLPLGHIVPDPIALGNAGKTHEHIQFGSGTFEPILSAQWANGRFVAAAEAKLSLYENRNGFRAPSTLSWSAGPTFRVRGVSIDPRLNGQVQTLARWSGEVDEGSGFRDAGVRLQLAAPLRGVTISPSVYRQLWSRGLAGQTFRQGTTWAVSLTRTF